MTENRITDVTRQQISDDVILAKILYYGDLNEADFLARLFDLKKLRSRDHRYSNAYDDIYKHMVDNNDWTADWMYTDPRINLLHCDDEKYLAFLALTIHPRVRKSEDQVGKLVEIYNRHLDADGFEIVKTDDSGKPIYSGMEKSLGHSQLTAKKVEIKKYLNTPYVSGKINTMTEALQIDTDLAIGSAKELLETVCKSILRQKVVAIDIDWTLAQLLKNTSLALDFTPKHAADPEKAERAIRQILGGITSIVQGVAELRNGYGTGHGKDADFKGLEPKYAKLLVGLVSEISILYLATNGETAELVEGD